MKKFLLTVLLIICFVPCVALADMGAPNSTAYDVIITNPDGVTIGTGKRKTTIPFDTKVTVNYEYESCPGSVGAPPRQESVTNV